MTVSCKSCKKKDKREYADDCFACDNGDKWEAKRHRSPNKPKTNADRIRSMTDEELAQWICCHITECERCEGRHYNGQECEFRDGRFVGLIWWLKEEVKDG